jgi:hypothetical protein
MRSHRRVASEEPGPAHEAIGRNREWESSGLNRARDVSSACSRSRRACVGDVVRDDLSSKVEGEK